MKPDDTLLSADDRRLVARIREGYAPPTPSTVDRARFDARLRARIEAHRRRRMWGLAGLTLAGAAAAVAVFALRPSEPAPTPTPGMAAAPAVDDAAGSPIALDWLVDDVSGDWLGGSTVLPADPLALPALAAATPVAADAVVDDDTDAADEATEAGETTPAWMPEEYTVLAGLIEIEPYDPYAEDWP